MATAVAGQPQEVKPRRQMKEVKAPEQFQFTQKNQMLSGVLLQIEPKGVKGKTVPEYLIVDAQGRFFTCLATVDLEKKMEMAFYQLGESPRGHWFDIRYESDDNSFQKAGQSAMKVFKVDVSTQIEPGYEHLHVGV